MPCVKKKKKDKDPTLVTRNHSIHQSVVVNSHKHLVFKWLTEHSKAIYNTSIFIIRQWFRVYSAQIEFVVAHLDDFLPRLSKDDRKKVARHLFFTKQESKLADLIATSHPSEDLNGMFDTNYPTLSESSSKSPNTNYCSIEEEIRIYEEINHSIPIKKYDNDAIDEFIANMVPILIRDKENHEQTQFNYEEAVRIAKEEGTWNEKDAKKKKPKEGNDYDDIIMPSFPRLTSIDMYIKSYCESGKSIGSQCVQQTTKKVYEAYKSYFKLHTKDAKAKLPKYTKNNHYNVIFQSTSFKIIDRESQKHAYKSAEKKKKQSKKKENCNLSNTYFFNFLHWFFLFAS